MAVDSDDPDRTDSVQEDLRRDLVAARQQQAATSEVLTALARSASDLDAILGTVVSSVPSPCVPTSLRSISSMATSIASRRAQPG